MATNQKQDVYSQWVTTSNVNWDQETGDAISRNLQRFRYQAPTDAFYGSVVAALTIPNAMIERWPQAARVLLNKGNRDFNEPFNTWVRPRDLDSRRRAIAVWSSMLAFIVFSWDFASRQLHEMGLFLGEEMKDLVDDTHFLCGLGGNKNFGSIREAAYKLFLLAVTDSEPSSRTNSILWWMAVLIRTQVLDDQPELPLGRPDKDFDPALTFNGKLEAFNHYARVLVLDSFIHQWKPTDYKSEGPFRNDSSAILEKVRADLHSDEIVWVDEDAERPPISVSTENRLMATPAWQECLAELRSLVDAWLNTDSRGPMREVLSLFNGSVPSRSNAQREEHNTSAPQPYWEGIAYEYKVMFQIWENYTKGQGGRNMGNWRPATTGAYSLGTYESAKKANKKARKIFKIELGSKSDAETWDEHVRDDGTVKIRAVFINLTDNAKAVAWVQRQTGTTWPSGGS
ncbi:MAG: hypothetical protein ASARMPRED_004855 [Alectoria sarmentosa]|nr:MAG: hypothetical protein ASARMPRED_004855 [Alectoria sarmentosa]